MSHKCCSYIDHYPLLLTLRNSMKTFSFKHFSMCTNHLDPIYLVKETLSTLTIRTTLVQHCGANAM